MMSNVQKITSGGQTPYRILVFSDFSQTLISIFLTFKRLIKKTILYTTYTFL